MKITVQPRHDNPFRTTARHLGQEAFIRLQSEGRYPVCPYEDDVRIRFFHEGFEREKGDWYQRPL